MALFQNVDGAVACFLPSWVVDAWASIKWLLLTAFAGFVVVSMGTRVRDEEAMLKEAFGKEWEEWHRKTSRFIPGLF